MINSKGSLHFAVLVGGVLSSFPAARADPDCIGLFVERNRLVPQVLDRV